MAASYETLQPESFRLLEFLDNSGVVCLLKQYPRRLTPPYIALSYTWGPSPYRKGRPIDAEYSLTLNGDAFPVQQNLHDALRHLGSRVRQRGHLFWVDAICINQNNVSERNEQVRHMKGIYEGAAGTFAWLGVPYDEQETRLAIQLMQRFNKNLHDGLRDNNNDIDIVLRGIDASHPGFPTAPESEPYTAWDGIAEMFNQPYWHRVWIYQEATTPSPITFFCGEHCFNDTLLSATVAFGITFSKFPAFPVHFIKAVGSGGGAGDISSARLSREKGGGRRLIDLMQEMRKADCTNSCDRVYAPLGHAVDVPTGRIIVDYKRTVVDLYTDVMRYLLLETDLELAALGYVFTPAHDSQNDYLRTRFDAEVPSWVPDWRQRVSISGFSHEKYLAEDKRPLYCPAPGRCDIRICGSELHVKGFVVQSAEITMLPDIFDDPKGSWQIPYAWYKQVMAEKGQIPGMREAVCRTLVADRSVAVRGYEENGYRRSWKRGGSIDWSLFEQRDMLDQASRMRMEDMDQAMFGVCYGRRMAVLGDETVAMPPPAARYGDKVAAFRGGRALYLLRCVSGGFLFIGECYVDGWMDKVTVEGGQYPETTLKLV
jgi:hypothetical protein